jgi:prepilin-type N-terminal cleavage/methylation domain-containing protein
MSKIKKGFTLVEMLVVVAIIALLVAILLPALSAAKEHAYDAVCRSNLHHLFEVLHTPGSNPENFRFPNVRSWIPKVMGSDSSGNLICPKDEDQTSDGALGMNGVTIINPPPSVVFNEYESSTIIHGFIEQDGFSLPSSVDVDIYEPGYYENNYDRNPTTIPAGTVVDSYFLFFDPLGSQNATSSGSVTFSADIIGIIVKTNKLDRSDVVLGKPGTEYPVGQNARGFENNAERITLENDMRTLTIHNFQSTFPGEHMRILTDRGGISSYGMNIFITPPNIRPGQLLLAEYDSTVVRAGGETHLEMLQARHFDHVNILYVSGKVSFKKVEELSKENKNWYPK